MSGFSGLSSEISQCPRCEQLDHRPVVPGMSVPVPMLEIDCTVFEQFRAQATAVPDALHECPKNEVRLFGHRIFRHDPAQHIDAFAADGHEHPALVSNDLADTAQADKIVKNG